MLVRIIVVLAFVSLLLAHPSLADWNPRMGMYSRHSMAIWNRIAGSPLPINIESPDHKTTVTAIYTETKDGDSNVKLLLINRVHDVQNMVDLGPGVGSEILWKSDSSAFLATTSDQGANGLYRTLYVSIRSAQTWDITDLIYRAFGHPFRCGWSEPPNVGGAGFTVDGNLLIAAEVVNHSNCDSSGTFVLYEVSPHSRTIIRKFNQLEAKRLFREKLGQELMQADDRCIHWPKSCYVSSNHPEVAQH